MNESTRRGFLILAGTGAAATAGVVAVANSSAGAATPESTDPVALPGTATGPLVAYVQDARSGRVAVMVGETEVVVSDPDLVARIARAAAGRKA